MESWNIPLVEWIGYAASAGILLSFLMRDVLKLRAINAAGCLLFTVYGFLLPHPSIPIIVTNFTIFCVNLYFVYAIRKRGK
ncbi:uroporphyrinogen decarboxylase [Sinomicrobium weinanense]|uniref:Uroporphyrinogen decarboxylase n=1 Tax=Sinomicrobium weinanense TaxID=2842200 RepID=A0A926Q513_9FLAO|nr:uroporphyrinogen decarboxylase [Sinomicrobium weinanense]MBC9797470.1 uroporphyrinogen decarboxylase [Sinomicrobium weinanense]MBU3124462.1 uroporphyrinogen decarboxylase [Sinomicrobium weinanense]